MPCSERRLPAGRSAAFQAAYRITPWVVGGYVLVSETLSAGQLTPALGLRMGFVYLAVGIRIAFCTSSGYVKRWLAAEAQLKHAALNPDRTL